MTENGLFILGGPKTRLHDILWAMHGGKNHGRSMDEENIGEFLVTVGRRGPSDARFSRTRMRMGARAVRNLGSSLALKVIAVSLHGFIDATWQTLQHRGVLPYAYYLRRRS